MTALMAPDMTWIWHGPTKDGLPHGWGKCTFANGTVYEGELDRDRYHGYGTMTTAAYTYRGEWRYNKRHGHGYTTWSNGDQHIGSWYAGEWHGPGCLIQNGVTTEGEWREGKRIR